MANSTAAQAAVELAKYFPLPLATTIIEEFRELEKTYTAQHWQYAATNAGRFCEAVARSLYALDSGNAPGNKSIDECFKYIENQQVSHKAPDLQAIFHICKTIRAVYKIRSQRGGVHVSPTFTADEYDTRFMLEGCRWVLSDLLRIFWNSDRQEVSKIIQELGRFSSPLLRRYGNTLLVQHTTCTTEEEVLILLYYNGNEGLTAKEIITSSPKDASGIRKSLLKLCASSHRQAVKVSDRYQITDLGTDRIEPTIRQFIK
jgi:hypothetical protein